MPGTAYNVSHTSTTDPFANQVFAMTREDYSKVFEEIVLQAIPFFRRNYKNKVDHPSVNIVQRLQVTEMAGSDNFKGMDQANQSYQQIFASSVLQLANVRTVSLLPWEEGIATGEGSEADASKLASMLTSAAAAAHANLLGYEMYMDASSTNNPSGAAVASGLDKGMNGLAEIWPGTANNTAYAGWNSSVYSGWKGQYNTATICNVGNVQRLISTVKIKGNVAKNSSLLGLTNQENWDRLFAVNQPAQLLKVESNTEVGYEFLKLSGVEIMVDSHCPSYLYSPSTITYGALKNSDTGAISNPLVPSTTNAEYFYVFNEDALQLHVHPRAAMSLQDYQYMGILGVEAYRAAYLTRLNLCCTNRRQGGVAVYTS